MTFLNNLPTRFKSKAAEFYQETFEEKKKTMNARLAHIEARNELQKFISEEYSRKNQ